MMYYRHVRNFPSLLASLAKWRSGSGTHGALIFVPEVSLKGGSSVEVSEELRVESEHDYAERKVNRPSNGFWVELDCLEEGEIVFNFDS